MYCFKILAVIIICLGCFKIHCQNIEYRKFGEAYNKAWRQLNGDLDSSLYYIDLAEKIALENDSISWRYRANLLEAVIYSDQEKYDKQDSLHHILDSLKSYVSKEYQVFFLHGMATAHHERNNYEKAFSLYLKANDLLDSSWLDYKIMKTGTLSNLGLLSKQLEDYNSAIYYNLKVLQLDENHYTTLNNLGYLFRVIGDFKTSKYYFNLCYNNKMIRYRSRYACLQGLQIVYNQMGMIDSSVYYLDKIVGNPDSCSYSTYFVAIDALTTHHISKGNFNKANKNLKVLDSLANNDRRKNNYLLTKAEFLRRKKDYSSAEGIYIGLSENKYFESLENRTKRDIYFGLLDCFIRKKKNPRLAKYLISYKEVLDSMKLINVAGAVINAERKYQVNKKESENIILKQKQELNISTIKNQKTTIISGSLILIGICIISLLQWKRYKDKVTHNRRIQDLKEEIDHRLRNQMNTALDILEKFKSKVKDSRVVKAFDDFEQRLYALSSLSQLLSSKNMSELVSISPYLEQVTKNLNFNANSDLHEKLKVSYSFCDVSLPSNHALNVALIITELFTNSLKHAFENNEEPKIVIEINEILEGSLKLIYQDNGKGIEDNRKLKGEGMNIINTMLRHVGGESNIVTNNEGFTFEALIPRKIA